MATFDSDGTRIHYEVFGAGAPVLLLHGFASNGRVNWISTGWTEALTEAGLSAIVMDHRGHGESEKLYRPRDYAVSLMAGDARRLLDHLGVERACVMGYSMGARVALSLAAEHPERVRGLVLAGLASEAPGRGFDPAAIVRAMEAERAEDVAPEQARAFRLFAEKTGSDLRALAACMRAGRAPLGGDVLAGLSMPVLVTAGEKDDVAGPPEALAARIPGARALVLPGKNHMSAVGDKAHKAAVLDFFRTIP